MNHLNFKRNIPVATVFGALGADVEDRPQDEIAVTGKLPERLNGVLFRNGPGKFRRDGRTKRTVLDGDGVVQRLELADGRARYGRRFVRTPKFQTGEAADRFLSPTWTTTAPGLLTNIGSPVRAGSSPRRSMPIAALLGSRCSMRLTSRPVPSRPSNSARPCP